MKRNPISLLLSAWLLAAAVSIGGAFCLGTAFRLPGPDAGLALALCLGSLAMALLQAAPRGWFWTLLAWLLGGGVAAARYGRAVYDSFRLVLASVSRLFAGAYPGFPSVELGGAIPAAASARPFLLVLGLLLAQLLAWTVMRRQSAVPALLFGILPVVLTHLLTDMPPADRRAVSAAHDPERPGAQPCWRRAADLVSGSASGSAAPGAFACHSPGRIYPAGWRRAASGSAALSLGAAERKPE